MESRVVHQIVKGTQNDVSLPLHACSSVVATPVVMTSRQILVSDTRHVPRLVRDVISFTETPSLIRNKKPVEGKGKNFLNKRNLYMGLDKNTTKAYVRRGLSHCPSRHYSSKVSGVTLVLRDWVTVKKG